MGSTGMAVSKAVTEYTPYAWPLIGRVKRVLIPFAANARFTSYRYGETMVRTIDP